MKIMNDAYKQWLQMENYAMDQQIWDKIMHILMKVPNLHSVSL